MEQISVRALAGKPLFVAKKNIGPIKKLAFDLTTGAVLGMIVKLKTVEKIIYREHILSINNDKVVAADKLETITKGSLADKANRQENHLIGLDALTESGDHFGEITDALLLSPTYNLTHLVVKDDSGERILPKDQIKEINEDAVVFFDSVVKGHLNWQTKIETDSLPA